MPLLSNFLDTQVTDVLFAEALVFIDAQRACSYSKASHWIFQTLWAWREAMFFMNLLANLRYKHGVRKDFKRPRDFTLPPGPSDLDRRAGRDDHDDHDGREDAPRSKKAKTSPSQLYTDPVVVDSGDRLVLSPVSSGASSGGKGGHGSPAMSSDDRVGRVTPATGSDGREGREGRDGSRHGNEQDEWLLEDDPFAPPGHPPSKIEHPEAFAMIPEAALPDIECPGGKHSYTIRHPDTPGVINVLVKTRAFYVKTVVNDEKFTGNRDSKGGVLCSWGKDVNVAWNKASTLAGWPAECRAAECREQ